VSSIIGDIPSAIPGTRRAVRVLLVAVGLVAIFLVLFGEVGQPVRDLLVSLSGGSLADQGRPHV
jgi:hypothetical protein